MVLNSHALYKKLHTLWNHRATLVFSLLVMTLACICATSWADALYIITGTDDAAIVLDGSAKVPDLSSQMVYVTSGGKGYDVTLAAGRSRSTTMVRLFPPSPRKRPFPSCWTACTLCPALWKWWRWTSPAPARS